jgi:hypothetical protein
VVGEAVVPLVVLWRFFTFYQQLILGAAIFGLLDRPARLRGSAASAS